MCANCMSDLHEIGAFDIKASAMDPFSCESRNMRANTRSVQRDADNKKDEEQRFNVQSQEMGSFVCRKSSS